MEVDWLESQKSVSDIIEEVRTEMCDKYCKYRERAINEDDIEMRCVDCPLNKL